MRTFSFEKWFGLQEKVKVQVKFIFNRMVLIRTRFEIEANTSTRKWRCSSRYVAGKKRENSLSHLANRSVTRPACKLIST